MFATAAAAAVPSSCSSSRSSSTSSNTTSPTNAPPNRGANIVVTIRPNDAQCPKLQKTLYLLGTYYNLFVLVDGSSWRSGDSGAVDEGAETSSSSSTVSLSSSLSSPSEDSQIRGFIQKIRSELLNECQVTTDATNNHDENGNGEYKLTSLILPPHRIVFSSTTRGRVAFVRQLHGTELVVEYEDEEGGVTKELERFGFRVLVYPIQTAGEVGGVVDGRTGTTKIQYSALGTFLIP